MKDNLIKYLKLFLFFSVFYGLMLLAINSRANPEEKTSIQGILFQSIIVGIVVAIGIVQINKSKRLNKKR